MKYMTLKQIKMNGKLYPENTVVELDPACSQTKRLFSCGALSEPMDESPKPEPKPKAKKATKKAE